MPTLPSFVKLAPVRSALWLACATLAVAAVACAPGDAPGEQHDDDHEHESPEPSEQASEALTTGSVGKAAKDGCSTGAVKGLSLQIIEEANCVTPDAYAKIPERGNITVQPNVFPYLEGPAKQRLVEAVDANPNKRMTINSALRTVAQQFMLHRWDQQNRCGIGLAASPGRSNHETGLALDIQEASSWKSALTSRGFSWLGSKDPVHFDYRGSGAVDHRGLDVLAFQRLWNRNHPEDLIAEDGDYGPKTAARLEKSPAAGFTIGAACNENVEEPAADPEPESGGADAADAADDGCPDACVEGAAIPASCGACASEVCATDDYCCSTAWDAACVGLATELSACGCATAG